MLKKQLFKGKTKEELQKMSIEEFMQLVPARERRSLKRGFTDQQKSLLLKIKKTNEGKYKKPIKTHTRDIVVIPAMLDLMIHIHAGREFVPVHITIQMLGHRLGEFTQTRKKVAHSAPGLGATRSSSAIAVK